MKEASPAVALLRSLEGRGAGEVKFSKGMTENLSPSPCSDHESWVWGLMSSPSRGRVLPAALLENVSPALGECLPKPLATFSHFSPLPIIFLHTSLNDVSLCQNYQLVTRLFL